MNYFDFLKEKDFLEVVVEGMKLSRDKEGFCEFAKENWDISNGDYVRAVVATAKLLKESGANKTHDIHVFDFIFGELGIEKPLEKYFDSDGSLIEEYAECLSDYDEIDALYAQLQKLTRYEYSPLIKNIDFCKLMDYRNKNVIISTVYGGQVSDKKLCKLRMYGGSNPRNTKVRVDGKVLPLVGTERGVLDIRDPETLEMLYQNHYLDSENLSSVQKAGFVYGVDEALSEYSKRVKEISSRSQGRSQVAQTEGEGERII